MLGGGGSTVLRYCSLMGALFVVSTVFAQGNIDTDDPAQSRYESFCGLEAAKAVASSFGKSWSVNLSTARLESNPISQFQDVRDALQSLGLHCRFDSIDRSSVGTLSQLFEANFERISAVAWTPTTIPEFQDTEIGHFIIVSEFTGDGTIRTFDPLSNRIGSIELREEVAIPILLVSDSESVLSRSWLIGAWFLSSSLNFTMAMAALIGMWILANWRSHNTDPRRKVGQRAVFCAGVAVACLIAAVLMKDRTGRNTPISRSLATDGSFVSSTRNRGVSFSQSSYDFGKLKVGSMEEREVLLRNDSDDAMKDIGISGSCSCFTVEPKTVSLEPNATCPVTIRFLGLMSGEKAYSVSAFSGGNTIATCDIHFTGVVDCRLLPLRAIAGRVSHSNPVLEFGFDVDEYYGAASSDIHLAVITPSACQFELLPDHVFERDGRIMVQAKLPDASEEQGITWTRLQFDIGLKEETISLAVDVGIEIAGS